MRKNFTKFVLLKKFKYISVHVLLETLGTIFKYSLCIFGFLILKNC